MIIRDITQRKRAEEEREQLQRQLNQVQKLESIGRLAGGVAHDFNNILSVIMGYTHTAKQRADADDPILTDLNEIQAAAQRSSEITRQLLAFARREAIEPVVLDLNETVEGMLKMLRRLIGEDIDLVWQPASRLAPVKMDPSQVDQMLANLCVNARDAIEGVGKVVIQTGATTVDPDDPTETGEIVPGRYVTLTVSDNGCGMEEQTLSTIFEPFFSTKEVGRGTGLGLATVYGIVKQNDGNILVDSEPGAGSTFTIYLPQHEREASAASGDMADMELAAAGSGETILVVEDEGAILALTKRALTDAGYNVLAAKSPTEALRIADLQGVTIDLLLTDVIMPEMNGRELAEQIGRIHPEIKCIYMSGYTADIISERGGIGANYQFIQKPFAFEELTAKVKATL